MLKNWDSLPKKMQQEEVKKYYTELSKKRGALGAKRFLDVVLAACMTVLLLPVMLIPVSYTHLDVYKRQSLVCGRELLLFIWMRGTEIYRNFYRYEPITEMRE